MKKITQFILIAGFLINIASSCARKHSSQASVTGTPKTVTKNAPYFLFISDIHLDISLEKTDSTTDTGMDLWNSFKKKIDSILNSNNPPSFVICGGDLPAHDNCDGKCYLTGSEAKKHDAELMVTLTDLRNLVSKHNIPLCYVPGNNDAVPGDYYSFTNDKGQTPFSLIPNLQNPYPAVNIPATSLSMPHSSMGYYSARVLPGLRIIAINSVIFANRYKPLDSISQLDAGNEEMAWVAGQLKDAKDKGDKVYIAMHIPPGTDAYKFEHHKTPATTWAPLPSAENSWLKTFLSLTNDYQTTIAGIFYGHTHMDELRLLYDSTGNNVTEAAISTPGITPQHGNNPGFKAISFNPTTMMLTDFITYYTTLPVTGSWGNNTYSFSSIFNNKQGRTIYDYIRSQPVDSINNAMNKIYTVMHGEPAYNTKSGMLIR